LLSLTHGAAIATKEKVSVIRADKLRPEVGDLLIYGANKDNDHFGHVAVVVRVHKDRVDIGEQNHSKAPWERDYSRSVPIVNGILSDTNLSGVVRFL
jgi:surface antigen